MVLFQRAVTYACIVMHGSKAIWIAFSVLSSFYQAFSGLSVTIYRAVTYIRLIRERIPCTYFTKESPEG